jgi:hypothetical protein
VSTVTVRHRQHPSVHRDVVEARKQPRRHGDEGMHRPRRERDADRGSGQGEHETFRNELSNDAPGGRAERGANRHLTRSARGANEKQIGDVCTGDQQHESHRAQNGVQRRPQIADELVLQRLDGAAEAGI